MLGDRLIKREGVLEIDAIVSKPSFSEEDGEWFVCIDEGCPVHCKTLGALLSSVT